MSRRWSMGRQRRKVGQVASARIAARDMAGQDPSILINAVCPRLTDTAASRPWFDNLSEALATDEAAKPIVDMLLAPKRVSAPNGQPVQHGRVLPWD